MSGLLHAFYWMDEGLQNHLKAAGLPPMSRTQSLVLTNIADGATRPAELARRLDISRQAVQQLLAGMQERGVIDLVPDPADARAKVIRYSPHGREIGKITMQALERIDEQIEQRLGGQQGIFRGVRAAGETPLQLPDGGQRFGRPLQPGRHPRQAVQ